MVVSGAGVEIGGEGVEWKEEDGGNRLAIHQPAANRVTADRSLSAASRKPLWPATIIASRCTMQHIALRLRERTAALRSLRYACLSESRNREREREREKERERGGRELLSRCQF